MLRLLRAAGSTVAYLHDAGVAHGALSPEHILGRADGTHLAPGLAVGHPARGPAGRRGAGPSLDADGARVDDRRVGADAGERPVAACGHVLRGADG